MKKQFLLLVPMLIFISFITHCWLTKDEEKKAVNLPGKEFSLSAAYDGTNYLVAIRGDITTTNNVTAQFMDTAGNMTGSRLAGIGHAEIWPIVLFDGTNYLLIWADETNDPGAKFYGQFINTTGTNIGSPFIIAEEAGHNNQNPPGLLGAVFDGANYFVAWNTAGSGPNIDLYGQFISPSGTLLGSLIPITTADGSQRDAVIGFDGTNILVVWADEPGGVDGCPTDIFGRFITKSVPGTAGALSGPIHIINQNGYPNDNPICVAFDGTNYMVVWMDEIVDHAWDIFGQRIDKSGNVVGGVISVSTAAGVQFIWGIAFDGTNYLVTWTDMRNDSDLDGICDSGEGTCWDIYGQYVGTDGSLVGTEFVINNDSGNQFGGVLGFDNAKYLIMVNTGVTWELTDGTFFAEFITP